MLNKQESSQYGRFELPRPKKYKGCISYIKIRTRGNKHLISKDRPFGKQAYQIEEEDFIWCDTYKKGGALWAYNHYRGTAHHYSDKNPHPRTGRKYSDEKNNLDTDCENGNHKEWWFYKKYKICQNCKIETNL